MPAPHKTGAGNNIRLPGERGGPGRHGKIPTPIAQPSGKTNTQKEGWPQTIKKISALIPGMKPLLGDNPDG